jgi:protein-disulfide isomerase
MRASAVAFAAALVLAPVAGVSKSVPARDWSRAVVATSQGGFRIGNPAAKVRLIEYGSLACPHCRAFEETGYAPLVATYVRTGKVSYEFRNIILNAPDISASLLAHCAGPAKFFPMAKVIYDTQPQWFGKVEALSDAQKAEIEKMSDAERMVRLADVAGLTKIAARFEMTSAKAHQCLADPKALQRLLDGTQSAVDSGITHTPTFLIDGKIVDASTWNDLEPKLQAASASL